ncbi:HEAT repeat domain-containing protein [Paenibacillus sp. SAF-054]|uniref:HEAT repeat domain-containing protein n=1 Tax=unclassified Paenibacillus TaxID=185978 RepID=UPI003F809672
MSQTLLNELNEEIRRLYIAGSDLAAGDYRLKRLLPTLQQLGERAPVFKKLGEGVEALIASPESGAAESARQLQDVNLLLQSVLRTQGQAGTSEHTVPFKSKPIALQTRLSYRKCSPLRTALTTRGGGRHEVILEAYREGLFNDLRLLPLAIEALNDPYMEIAELAMTDILPSYGPDVAVHLLESFDPMGGKLEARKLTVAARSGDPSAYAVVYDAALTGSNEVRTTAIRLLAGHSEYEQALLDFSRDKKKGIREAAFYALAESGWDSAAERLYEASKDKDSELVNSSLARCQSEKLNGWLIRDFAELMASLPEVLDSKEKTEEIWTRTKRYLWSLHQKKSPELEQLYLGVLRQYNLYMFKLGWVFLANEAMDYIGKTGSAEGAELMRSAVEMDLKKFAGSHSYARETFRKAQPILAPERLYEEYSVLVQNLAKASAVSRSVNNAKQLLDTIEDMVITRRYQAYEQIWNDGNTEAYTYIVEMPPPSEMETKWDARWLDHFIERDHLALVSAFARPNHEEASAFLLRKLRNSPEFRNRFANLAVMGLVRADLEETRLHEALMQAMEDERNTECREIEPFLFEQLCRLPVSYAERIKAALPKFTSHAEQQLEYILKTMKPIEQGAC